MKHINNKTYSNFRRFQSQKDNCWSENESALFLKRVNVLTPSKLIILSRNLLKIPTQIKVLYKGYICLKYGNLSAFLLKQDSSNNIFEEILK